MERSSIVGFVCLGRFVYRTKEHQPPADSHSFRFERLVVPRFPVVYYEMNISEASQPVYDEVRLSPGTVMHTHYGEK